MTESEGPGWNHLYPDAYMIIANACESLLPREISALIDDALPEFEEGCEAPVPRVLVHYATAANRVHRVLLRFALSKKCTEDDKPRLRDALKEISALRYN